MPLLWQWFWKNNESFFTSFKTQWAYKIAKELDFSKSQDLLVNIHRNHAFEGVQSIIAPFYILLI